MFQLRERIRATFAKPMGKLAEIMFSLRVLREALHQIEREPDALRVIVPFFDVISRWQDRGFNDVIVAFEEANFSGKYDDALERLRTLELHFENAGRNEHGMNRTKPGESVTADKVFLGNIFGLFTHPVSYWRRGRNDKKGGWEGGTWDGHPAVEGKNAYDVVSQQAHDFMIPHIGSMCELIKELDEMVLAA